MGGLHRAQVLLDEGQHRALADLARSEGRTVSELTREAIARYLAEREGSQPGQVKTTRESYTSS